MSFLVPAFSQNRFRFAAGFRPENMCFIHGKFNNKHVALLQVLYKGTCVLAVASSMGHMVEMP
jgi:hypothetical protein